MDCCSTSSSGKIPCCLWGTPRQAGWISMLVLEQLRNAVQPPGPRTVYLRPSGAPAGAWGDAAREGGVLAAKAVENVWQRQGLSCVRSGNKRQRQWLGREGSGKRVAKVMGKTRPMVDGRGKRGEETRLTRWKRRAQCSEQTRQKAVGTRRGSATWPECTGCARRRPRLAAHLRPT